MINYLSAAKALDELMLELIGKGMDIPTHVLEDFKAGRSLAAIHARQPDNADIAVKAAAALETVEMNLLALVEVSGGAAYANAWQARIADAYQQETAPPAAAKIAYRVPKGVSWIRFQTSELPDSINPDDFALTATAQEDGYTLICGKQENLAALLKEIRLIIGKVGFKRNS